MSLGTKAFELDAAQAVAEPSQQLGDIPLAEPIQNPAPVPTLNAVAEFPESGAVFHMNAPNESTKNNTAVSILFIQKSTPSKSELERWVVPKKLRSVSVMGGHKYDFRNAVFVHDTCTIYAGALLGSVRIVVPPGVKVVSKGVGLLGGFDSNVADPPSGPAPTIVVKGSATLGGVHVVLDRSAPAVRVVG